MDSGVFTEDSVAFLLNDNFVPVKLDAESDMVWLMNGETVSTGELLREITRNEFRGIPAYVFILPNRKGYVNAFSWNGEPIWKKCYGPEWTLSFRGAWAAPVLDESRLYICSGLGKLVCYEALTGHEIWNIDLVEDLGGKNVNYGYSMPAMIQGEKLLCSPGLKLQPFTWYGVELE